MKKIFFAFVFVILLFGIFAAAEETIVSSEVSAVVDRVGDSNLAPEVSGFVQDFVEKRGIGAEDIKNIERVNFNDLPKEVNIENVGDSNLAIYQVDYNDSQGDKKIFVVAYSVDKLNAQGDLIIAQDKREFLDFGHSGEMSGPRFLDTATGVETSLDKGYVMPRDGSITAVSTNVEISQIGTGSIEIIIYKNGEKVGFGNVLDATTQGIKKDYDVQSKGTVPFNAGDVISLYVKSSESESGVTWKDVITIVEITSTN